MCGKDAECIKQCLNGHPDEYRGLVRRYQASLLSFLTGRLKDRERAEEAAQETFVRAYFSLRKLKKPDAFFSWLVGIGQRVALEQRRESPSRPVRLEMIPEAPEEMEASMDLELEKAVADLPDPYREIVLLRYYGGRSCSQLSEQMGVTIGTITKRLSRAYALLRKQLKRESRESYHSEVQP